METRTLTLPPDGWLLLEGLAADYRRRVLLDLSRGGLTPTGVQNYLKDAATAGLILDALKAKEAA